MIEFFQNTPTDDHIALFSSYLDLVAGGLQNAYPNLSSRDAQALILKGILKHKVIWKDLLEKTLANKNLKIDMIDAIDDKYSKNISGTTCN